MFDDLDGDVFLELYGLNEGNLMDLSFYSDLRDSDGHLNILLNLSNLHPSLIDNPWNLHLYNLQFLHNPQHLSDHLYLPWWQFDNPFNRYYLFNDLLLDLNPLLVVMHWDYFLHDFSYDFDPCLHVWHDLWNFFVADHLNDLLYDLRDDHDLLPFYYLLYYLFDDDFNWLQDFFFCLDVADHLLDDLHHFDLLLHYDLLHLHHHWLLDLHDLLNNHLLRL